MPLEQKQILLADDDLDTLLILKDRLKSFGFHVTAVSNGREVVEEMKRKRYAVVIMDIMMPEMDGIEALRMIRQIQPQVPVIMITASREKAMASLAEGAEGCLLKPIDPERLKETVDRWFLEKA